MSLPWPSRMPPPSPRGGASRPLARRDSFLRREQDTEREIIPIDHELRWREFIGPVMSDLSDVSASMSVLWDRIVNQPSYSSLPMTDELFQDAMDEAISRLDADQARRHEQLAAQALIEAQIDALKYVDTVAGADTAIPNDLHGFPGDLPDASGACESTDLGGSWDQLAPVGEYSPLSSDGGLLPLEEPTESVAPPALTLEDRLCETDQEPPPWMLPGA